MTNPRLLAHTKIVRYSVTMAFIGIVLLLSVSTTAEGRGIEYRSEAQSKPKEESIQIKRIELYRLEGSITLDGRSDEPAWEGVESLPFVMFMPNFGEKPSQRTEALIAYDDDYMYVAGRLYDNDPSKIQSNSKQRDSMDPSSDWFGIVIDSYNDKENAFLLTYLSNGLQVVPEP